MRDANIGLNGAAANVVKVVIGVELDPVVYVVACNDAVL